VQLFNAVRKQQTCNTKISKTGPLKRKHEQVLKRIDKKAFLNILSGSKSIRIDESDKIKNTIQNKENEVSIIFT